MKLTVEVGGERFVVEVGDLNSRPIVATVDGQRFEVWTQDASAPRVAAPETASAPLPATPPAPGSAVPPMPRARRGEASAVGAPLPGVVVAIQVQAGSTVRAGQELVVLEAMKMKNAIRAPRAGRIDAVLVSVGQRVQHGEPLVRYAAS